MCVHEFDPTQMKQNVKSSRILNLLLTTDAVGVAPSRRPHTWTATGTVVWVQSALWYNHKKSRILGNHLAKLFQIIVSQLRLGKVNGLTQDHSSVVGPRLEALIYLLNQTNAFSPAMKCQKTRLHNVQYQYRTMCSGYDPTSNYSVTLINGEKVILNTSDPNLGFCKLMHIFLMELWRKFVLLHTVNLRCKAA